MRQPTPRPLRGQTPTPLPPPPIFGGGGERDHPPFSYQEKGGQGGMRWGPERPGASTLSLTVYFDRRLFGFTWLVRGRVLLCTIIGLAAVPVSIWRLTLTGQTLAQVFQGA